MEIYHFKILKLTLLFFLSAIQIGLAQSEFYAINAKYDDSAAEWYVYTLNAEGDDIESEIRLKWPFKNDWTEWSIIHNDAYHNIKLKYKNSPDHWEMRTEDGRIITLKTKWTNDFTEWIVSDDELKLKWVSEYRNNMSSWYFEHETLGYMNMLTFNVGDARDWILEDMSETVNDEMKMAMIFITTYLTNPKR